MRDRILSYLCLCLVLIVAFVVASFDRGFGYVYIQWLGWQFQSNLFAILLTLFVMMGLLSLVWLAIRRLFRRNLQKHIVPNSFQDLHPYERLGVVWLLNAERSEQTRILSVYDQSELLKALIQAKLMLNQGQLDEAKHCLETTKTPLFELVKLLKIDAALIEKDQAFALEQLEFLTVQPLSAWLHPVEPAYRAELQQKWLQLSQTCPWWLFKASHQPVFDDEQQLLWLQALLDQRDVADIEDQQAFFKWFEQIKATDTLKTLPLANKITILKLLNEYEVWIRQYPQDSHHQIPNDHQIQVIDFAQQILQERFVPEVLYIWLNQTLKQHDVNLNDLEQRIDAWEQLYPAQPSLTFAKWHLYRHQGRFEYADALLTQFPDDPYMAYLRLQQAFASSNSLQNDLKRLLQYSEQDFKFDL